MMWGWRVKTEDIIIAHTWRTYLKTKNYRWPALFPRADLKTFGSIDIVPVKYREAVTEFQRKPRMYTPSLADSKSLIQLNQNDFKHAVSFPCLDLTSSLDRTQNRTFCKVDVTLSHAHAQKGSQTFLLPLIALSSNYPAYFQRKTFHPLPKAGEKSFWLF